MTEIDTSLAAWQAFFDNKTKGHETLVAGYLRYVAKLEERGLPPIFELRHLAKLVGVEEPLLVRVIENSGQFYREFAIPKRSGGERRIETPSPFLLHAQRWIGENILSKVELHEAVHGFAKGRSIVSNASVHLGQQAIMKLDLKDFFPSIHIRQVVKVFLWLGYPVSVSYFLASICCSQKRLPQGSAASPALSNIVARKLDKSLSTFAVERALAYTRYADDLTFSGENFGSTELSEVTWIIERSGFKINSGKTRLLKGRKQKIVTGVSISSGKLALPRKTVRSIKLEAYNLLKYGYFEHCKATNQRDPLLMERLLGRIGFWLQVDPTNKTALRLQREVTEYVKCFDKSL